VVLVDKIQSRQVVDQKFEIRGAVCLDGRAIFSFRERKYCFEVSHRQGHDSKFNVRSRDTRSEMYTTYMYQSDTVPDIFSS
jgi:hypothetical protein